MNWTEVRKMLGSKLGASSVPKSKHDTWHVYCGEVYVGCVLDSRGKGEVKGRELGNIARSLRLSEHQLKELQRCTLSKEQFCAEVTAP
jgi:hypothetical protein